MIIEILPANGQPGCRACGSERVARAMHVSGYDLMKCHVCGSLSTAAQMPPAQARSFYGPAYFRGGDYADYVGDEAVIKRNFSRFARRLRQWLPRGRMLEIGCAYGFFLDVACQTWDVEGIDIAEQAVTAASLRHGRRVRSGDVLASSHVAGSYDWVVAWDVIEHLDQPRAFLTRAFELLRPGGLLALTTGDIGSPAARIAGRRWRLLTPPSHLTYFTRPGQQRAMDSAGFSVPSISTAGYDRSFRFAFFRLLGAERFERLAPVGSRRRRWLETAHLYLNLGDVMFVVAQKPGAVISP